MAGGFVSVVTRVKNVLLNLFVVHFVTSTEWKTDCKIIYNIRKKKRCINLPHTEDTD